MGNNQKNEKRNIPVVGRISRFNGNNSFHRETYFDRDHYTDRRRYKEVRNEDKLVPALCQRHWNYQLAHHD